MYISGILPVPYGFLTPSITEPVEELHESEVPERKSALAHLCGSCPAIHNRTKHTGRSQKPLRAIISIPTAETKVHPEDGFCGIGVPKVDRIIFCVFLEIDYKIFKKKMGEFFPLDDANEEGTELSAETGLEQKSQTPSPTKSKAEQPEDLQDDAEGGNGTAEKQNTDETEAQIQQADETKPSAVASLSSPEDTELSEDKDSLKGSKGTWESDPAHPVPCQQDQAEGQQDVPAKEEMKTGADSQSSCMEIEETLLNQEDTTEVETPLIPGAEEKEEGKEEGVARMTRNSRMDLFKWWEQACARGGVIRKKAVWETKSPQYLIPPPKLSYKSHKSQDLNVNTGMQGQEESSVEPMKIDLASEAADVSNKDAEMNSQVENINDPMETERKA
ncbi:hypothetical protein WISP_127891 [Willisornis vidua]|uniref:Uncharacterized protein n=1 Tax=Willisornis vidua TaxID=1566151 RepID=A0ABQ9CQD8_9PASS|nr:hypothetical protein WISP_127891 [Willisornis vidua]